MKPSSAARPPAPSAARKKVRAFTLVEIITAATVGGLVLAAVASILVVSLRLVTKNQQIDVAITNTRLVQEHINGEMAIAISQTSPVMIRPTFSSPSSTTPVRYAVMTYRVPIGSYATVLSTTVNTSTSITIVCPSDVTPKAGDYFLMDSPNLGSGIRITGVSGSGNVTLTLGSTILAGIVAGETPVDAIAGKLVRIQRERKYETIPPTPSTNPITELHWYETTIDSTYLTLSKNVDSYSRYLFAQVPADTSPTTPALESSVSWQFSYVSSGSNAYNMGGDKSFYQSNFAEGLIMPKSGNPLSASSILGGGSTSLGTTTTTTLGSTTTFESSTTLKSTTLRSSTTLKSTTLQSSTTLRSTTLQSTTLKTTTQKSSTTLKTTTQQSSTTLKSTTLQSSTTLKSTTLQSSTTLKSTTLQSSTTLKSTTVQSTTLKSTTLQSSTTLKSTTTTTIPFDG
jgi:hypothetical protein